MWWTHQNLYTPPRALRPGIWTHDVWIVSPARRATEPPGRATSRGYGHLNVISIPFWSRVFHYENGIRNHQAAPCYKGFELLRPGVEFHYENAFREHKTSPRYKSIEWIYLIRHQYQQSCNTIRGYEHLSVIFILFWSRGLNLFMKMTSGTINQPWPYRPTNATSKLNWLPILTFEQTYSGLVRKCCQFADGLGAVKQKITFSDFRISTFLNSEYFIVKSQKKILKSQFLK